MIEDRIEEPGTWEMRPEWYAAEDPRAGDRGEASESAGWSKAVRRWGWWCWTSAGNGAGLTFGFISLVVGLSAVATIPLLQFISLGYLLEVTRRVSLQGRLRDGLVGLEQAAYLGRLIFGAGLVSLPLFVSSHLSYAAFLIEPSGEAAARGERITWLLGGLFAFHVLAAWYAGGRWRDFLWPLLAPWILVRLIRHRPWRNWFPPAMLLVAFWQGCWWRVSRDACWEVLTGLHLPYLFWLGMRAFVGTLIWLLPPVFLLVAAVEMDRDGAPLLGAIGVVLMVYVMLLLPHLQAQFARHQRFPALFGVRAVRRAFRRAPVAYLVAIVGTLLLATPLYLLKIEVSPRELAVVASLFFVTFGIPGRMLVGWSVARAERAPRDRHPCFRWGARLLLIPLVAFYVLLALLTQYSSWYGTWSLLEQHAVMVPVPFLEIR
jgi:hypothetical protein